jgi:uncharacterized membrane protein
MSTTFVSSAWPAPGPWPAAARWHFAHEVRELRDGVQSVALQWLMARNGCLGGERMLRIYALLCTVSLGIGVAFWWLGAPTILPLAGIELLLIGLAFWVNARHAGDAETITLAERELRVEHRFGRAVENAAFRAEWVRVEPEHGEGSLVELSGQGRRVRVGRYIRPEMRMALARELRLALRRENARSPSDETSLEQQR